MEKVKDFLVGFIFLTLLLSLFVVVMYSILIYPEILLILFGLPFVYIAIMTVFNFIVETGRDVRKGTKEEFKQ